MSESDNKPFMVPGVTYKMCGNTTAYINRLEQQLAAVQAEIKEAAMQAVSNFGELQIALEQRDRLQAIVDKLPKTVDGVLVTECKSLWFLPGLMSNEPPVELDHFLCREGEWLGVWTRAYTPSLRISIGECYSTRQAAQAALDKGASDET